MIYVGIDIAKLDHYASAIDSDGVVLIEPFKFRNDADGFHTLSSRLESLPPGDKVIIGLESTAHYGNNLVRYLVCRSYDVCILNPDSDRHSAEEQHPQDQDGQSGHICHLKGTCYAAVSSLHKLR